MEGSGEGGPISCQGWGRGFESLRPLHFARKIPLSCQIVTGDCEGLAECLRRKTSNISSNRLRHHVRFSHAPGNHLALRPSRSRGVRASWIGAASSDIPLGSKSPMIALAAARHASRSLLERANSNASGRSLAERRCEPRRHPLRPSSAPCPRVSAMNMSPTATRSRFPQEKRLERH